MNKKKGLGKGLDALFFDNHTEDSIVSMLKITDIEPNQDQPRTDFDDAALRELADSIREHGILQPLVVRPLDGGGYQIVAGERRWRAGRMAGLSDVPVVVKDLDDNQALQIAIIENLQREDLNAIELAKGYKSLIDEYGMTQEQVAKKLGKSRPVIANAVRLLNLPDPVQQQIRSGSLTMGHAKALLALDNEEEMIEAAQKASEGKLLVRDIERMSKEKKLKSYLDLNSQEPLASPIWGDNYYKEMEIALSTELGRKVSIHATGKKSTITFEFYNDEDLSEIAARLTKTYR